MDKNLEKNILVFLFLLPLIPPLAYAALLIAFIIWLRRGWRPDLNCYLDPSSPNLYFIILVLAAFFSAIFSNHRLLSLANFLLFLVFPLTYYFFYENIGGFNRRKILLSILLSGLLVSLLGLLQKAGLGFEYHSKFLEIYFREDGGIRSTLGHPNRVANYLVLITPLVLIPALTGKRKEKIFALLFLACVIPAIILTTCMGGVIALLLVFIIFILLRKRKAGLVLIGLLLLFLTLRLDLTREIIEKYSTMEQRIYTWREISPRIFLDHPLTGIGIGTYAKVSPLYGDPEQILTTHLHNLYLRVLIDLGLLGFIPFLLFMFTFFKRIILYLRKNSFYVLNGLVAGCGLAILGLLLHAMVEDIIDFFPIGLLFWSIAGMAAGLTERAKSSPSLSSR